ncbi:MAG: 3-oxoacyl-ACP reductase FabG [Deltaproteobacteria bacterium]|nr:3-oxoacyl-ACP reductase FabG [Deltaproteobacteria bacterium]
MKLNNRVALVTGAGSGIGRAIAVELAQEGAKIGVNDINEKAIDETLRILQDLGASGIALKADIGNVSEVKGMFKKLKETYGTIDILVNNAGIAMPPSWVVYKERSNNAALKAMGEVMETGKMQESMKITSSFEDEWWLITLNVHLNGTFYCTREALKIMEEKRKGKIINLSSVTALHGEPIVPAYSAAKAGIIGFTKAVAQEVIGSGIIVNALAPGYIDTPLLDGMDDRVKQMIIARTPAGRLGNAKEIASLVAYLATDDANYIVGQVISPNGGMVI